MAEIVPFAGLRYDLSRVDDAARVLAPPYDVIGEAERSDLEARHPHNVVRLELPRGDGDARYGAAANLLRAWRAEGVLKRDATPSMYLYEQQFSWAGRPYTRRGFIAGIVPLYRLRGTPAGLQQMLTLYTGEPVDIYDAFDNPPYFFEVRLTLSEADPALLQAKQQIARAIIDQEKPAHTFYSLQIAVPSMRLVSQARHERENAPLLILGTNTLLGTSIPNL